MALAEPVYRYSSRATAAQQQQRSQDVRAMRTGTREQQEGTTPIFITLARMAAILIFAIAAFSFARVALTSATVTTMIESDALSSEIADARSTGVSLEMEQAVLSNPSAIRQAAKRFGMIAPYEMDVIELDADVVATEADGSLSLSGTVKNFVEMQD